MPDLAQHVWAYFRALHVRRSPGIAGPQPLTYEAILAWCNLYQVRLSLWELETLELLDLTWIDVMQERKDG